MSPLWMIGLLLSVMSVAHLHGQPRQPQEIEWVSPLDDARLGLGTHLLEASAGSGLPVRFRVLDGPGRVKGTELTIEGEGRLTIQAEQPGNLDYLPVAATRSFRAFGEQKIIRLEETSPWSILNPFSRPVTALFTNGNFQINAPAPEDLRLLFNSTAVDLHRQFTNCAASLVFSDWDAVEDGSLSIGLLLRSTIHPDHRRDWYGAYVVPKPLPEAAGTFLQKLQSTALFSIVKVHRLSRPIRLAAAEIPPLDPGKKYRVEFSVRGNQLTAALFEQGKDERIAVLRAVDDDFEAGFPSVMLIDQKGMLGKGNDPLKLTIHDFHVTED